MSEIAKGRAEFLQDGIVRAIKKAKNIDTLSDGAVKEIFSELLDDATINAKTSGVEQK